jgi:hypothetical protein
MNEPQANAETLLGCVFDDLRDGLRNTISPEEYNRRKYDFVFHMLDWKEDLDRLIELFSEPGQYSRDSATKLIVGFLYHVVPHLDAAFTLLLDGPSEHR